MTLIDVPMLMGPARRAPSGFVIVEADAAELTRYRRLRRESFVDEQGLFERDDLDALDHDRRTVVLVARDGAGRTIGGVRIAPATEIDLGWWSGSRLVVARPARGSGGGGVAAALVRAACAEAESRGVLRFEATVQKQHEPLFDRLGWERLGPAVVAGAPHVRMRWPVDRIQRLVGRSKAYLGDLIAPLGPAVHGFAGDDGAPVSGTDVVVACDAILPAMVERDPDWAGWCGVLVNVNDLSAMGARPVGLLDALGARDAASASLVVEGMRRAADAWGVPVLGGHTQLGVPASLAVTAIGRAADPVPGGGGSAGHALSVTADTGGRWRPGYRGAQWDSTSFRTGEELRHLAGLVAGARPAAAKDVSMSGLVGTVGMLAEASGTGAELEVAAIPRPTAAAMGDWLTCFPGFAMVTADAAGRSRMESPIARTAECGVLTDTPGVRLRWPDGAVTTAVSGPVTGFGAAAAPAAPDTTGAPDTMEAPDTTDAPDTMERSTTWR